MRHLFLSNFTKLSHTLEYDTQDHSNMVFMHLQTSSATTFSGVTLQVWRGT